MKRFRFRLGRLERMRDLERREARAALTRALFEARRRAEGRERQEAAVEWSRSVELPRDLRSDAAALRQLCDWRDGRRRLLEHAVEREREAQEKAEEENLRHTEAARGHRVLERLHERRRQRWMQAAELEEQKFIDEIHLLRILRTREREEE